MIELETGCEANRYWKVETFATAAAARQHGAEAWQPHGDDRLDLTYFVSCYNEADSIARTLGTAIAAAHAADLTFEILVIDDGSTDGSCEVVRRYIAAHPDEEIVLRKNPSNRGLAQNYVDGAFLGRGRYYRLVCGDDSTPLDDMVSVLRAVGQADCIVPYYTPLPDRSFARRLLSTTYTFVINAVSGYNIRYFNGLPVLRRRDVMRWHTNTRGFGFQAEILCLLLDHGLSCKQVPVRAIEQRTGKSNAITLQNFLSVAHTIVEIANRRLSRVIYRRD